MRNKDTKEIISYLKDKGYVYAGSEIYGGLANSWDFGPLGSMLKSNIKDIWKARFVDQQENVYHLDSGIILNPKVWEASGHVGKFNDPMVDCKECKERFRADHLIEEHTDVNPDTLSLEEQTVIIKEQIKCPNCGSSNWTDARNFELMFKTSNSKLGEGDDLYLRPETAQGVFINFKSVVDTMNAKVPFGIGQIGKAFRNEVTPGNFIFRTKEFEQLELEFFTKGEEAPKWFEFYLDKIESFLENDLKLSRDNFKRYEVPGESLAHYSSRTVDFEYKFPFGWGEILGLANRGDFDLTNHSNASGKDLIYFDQKNNEKYIPHIVETSMGVERLLFAIASQHLVVEGEGEEEREIFKLPFSLSPYKLSVMPLTNKLEEQANELFQDLLKQGIGAINMATSGSIGKRYRKQDAIGTPFIVTYDFDSLEDGKVTIRNRDDMSQERILISDIKKYILENAR